MPDDKPKPGQPGADPAGPRTPAPAPSAGEDVAAFIAKVKAMAPQPGGAARGRLIFGMDATFSREPAWNLALSLQADMFREVQAIGGLDVQLIYFRGADECRASGWVSDAEGLARLMRGIACQGGFTQIRKVLSHARRETEKARVNALVYVGDAMEEEIDHLSALAGELGMLGAPAFLFQEGSDPKAEKAFRELARLSRGAYSRFDAGSARQLRELLQAVAVYAAGGRAALEGRSRDKGGGARILLEQLKG